MSGDLVSGRYPLTHPLSKLLGSFNAVQGNIAYRSNLEWFGLPALADTATIVGSGVQVSVPVPVEAGDVIKTVGIVVGATAASTPTHQFGALYKGTGAAPALIGQSTDATTAAIAASAVYSFTLTTPYIVNPTDCPNGFIYASFGITGTAYPSVATAATATATYYQWLTTMPVKGVNAMSHGSAVGATAAATIATPTALATTPVVFLA